MTPDHRDMIQRAYGDGGAEGSRAAGIVARAIGFGPRTAQRLIKSDFARPFAWLHPEHERKWSDDTLDLVAKVIKKNPTITLQTIVDEFVGQGEELITDSTWATYLDGRLFTYKQVTRQMLKVVFVGDNCRIHSKDSLPDLLRQLVREAAEQGAGTFDYTLKFLPPYCPMLKPIELCFKDFKHEIWRLLDGPMH